VVLFARNRKNYPNGMEFIITEERSVLNALLRRESGSTMIA
jgi:hypothetical protein